MSIFHERKLNLKYPFLLQNLISILFKIAFINLVNLENLNVLNNYNSEIHLIIKGIGNQNILNNKFNPEPSEVIVNGYQNNSCKKTCYFFDGLNNITLRFDNQINSFKEMFKDLGNILEIDLSNFDASQVTSMSEMFRGCSNLTSIILPNSNTNYLNETTKMFYNCSNLEKINFGNINTSSVEDMKFLFSHCSKIKTIDLSKFDTSKVKKMSFMFFYCTNLEKINFGNIDTSYVEEMESLFSHCSNLKSIDLSKFNTSHVTTFFNMFNDCSKLSSINLSSFDTSSVKIMSYMFYNCQNLESIYFGNINTSSVEDMNRLFCHCSKISSIDLSSFDTSKVKNMSHMFYNCSNLEKINFGNINTSSVEDMNSLFSNCYNLSSINLSNFDTSHVTTFVKMFYSCKKLRYLDLSNFNTLSLVSIDKMFYDCESLIYLNLFSFELNNTVSKNTVFKQIYPNYIFCTKDNFTKNYLFGYNAISICLKPCSNYNNKRLNISYDGCIESCINYGFEYEYKNTCYHECPNETYELYYDNNNNIIINNSKECYDTVPIGYYLDKNEKKYKKCYENCKSCYGDGNETYNNCEQCIDNFRLYNNLENISNCYPKCNDNYNYYFNESNIYHCTENSGCPEKYNKLIIDKAKCIDDCKKDDIYKYEFKNDCYNKCPENTYTNETKEFFCILSSNNEYYTHESNFINSSESENKYECNKDNNIYDICYFQNIKNDANILNIIKQNIDSLYDSEKGKIQIIKGDDDVIYQITNSKNEKELLENTDLNKQNLTILDLGKCEDKLKQIYNIDDKDSLIYLKKENVNSKVSEKDFQYEIYEPYNYTKLDISICNEEKINIYIPLILSDEMKNIYEDMKSYGYDMFNINDPFYQDLCTPYTTKNSTDIPLSARKKYIYNNEDSQCQKNCYFSSYIPNSLYVNCTCDIESKEGTEVIKAFNVKTLYESFYDVLKYANFQILKCYKLAFNINIFNYNIGNFIIISLFSINLICLFIFMIKGISSLKNKIKKFNYPLNEEIERKNNIFTLNIIYPNQKKITKSKKSKLLKSNKKFKKLKINKVKKLNNTLFTSRNENLIKKNKIDNIISKKLERKFDEYELDELEYEKAIFYDKRNFFKIYWNKLCREHIIIFTFFVCNDYNIINIKYARFVFLLATDMAINVFFFSDDSMHKIYLNYGKFNFIQQIPQIIYTTIISQIIEIFLCYMSLTDKYIYEIKKMTNNANKKNILRILKSIKIKLVVFFIFTFIFFLFYWYTVTTFCAVYKNTQITFIKDSLLSFILNILYPLAIYLIPSFLRIISLRCTQKNKLKCLYKLSDIIPFF